MTDYINFFNIYIMGNAQILTGFYFLGKFLRKKIKIYFYIVFALFWTGLTAVISAERIGEFLLYMLLLVISGIFICHTEWKQVMLYSALTVEIMQLSYGIVNCLFGILYPAIRPANQKAAGLIFMLAGQMAALLLAVLCYYITNRFFSYYEAVKKQYVLMILTPVLMLFLMGEYVNSISYSDVIKNKEIMTGTNHYEMFAMQLLGMASLFCIMFAYKKLLQNFRLSTELSLLEQEEHLLNQYVEESKARYEKTKSFRHDVKNHIMVVKQLLQSGKEEQALDYIGDLGDMTEELSFPCHTNNPVVDILIENKLGIAKTLGIDVDCPLHLPYPCFVRDIDFCIVLSNALDNAIHACKNMCGSGKKYIHVNGRIQGDFVLLEIENSFHGNGLIRTGTGLSNIKKVAEKYHGAMNVKTSATSFNLSVLLIISHQSEHTPGSHPIASQLTGLAK